MTFLLSPGVIFGALFMGLCATFFYIYGENERSAGWKWALLSFGIWIFLALLLGLGLILQILGQLVLLGIITWYDMNHPKETTITK